MKPTPHGLPRPHRHLDKFKGKNWYTFNVRVRQSSLEFDRSCIIQVLASSAADACNYIRDQIASHVTDPTEVETLGPLGGVTHRFIGWHSMVAAQFAAGEFTRTQTQLKLF